MTAEMVEFLRAREAEREQDALAATPGPWRHNPDKQWRKPGTAWFEEAVFAGPAGDAAVCIAGTGESDDPQSMADARHIAQNDPAWVLADMEAKRELISLLEDHAVNGDRQARWLAVTSLKYLASAHVSHPDFHSEWADL